MENGDSPDLHYKLGLLARNRSREKIDPSEISRRILQDLPVRDKTVLLIPFEEKSFKTRPDRESQNAF